MRLSSWRWKAIIPVSCKEAGPEQTVRRRWKHCDSQHLAAAGCGRGWVAVCRGAAVYCLLWTWVLGAAGCPGLCVWAQPSCFCFAKRAEDALGQNNCHGNIPCMLFHQGWCWCLSCAAGMLGGLWPSRAAQVTTGWKDERCLLGKVIQHVLWQQIWEYPCELIWHPWGRRWFLPLVFLQAPEHQFSELCLGGVRGEQTVPCRSWELLGLGGCVAGIEPVGERIEPWACRLSCHFGAGGSIGVFCQGVSHWVL